MAKKSYQKMTAYNSEIKSKGADTSEIVLTGRNSKGTDVIVTVTVDDYFFPYMIKDMIKIGRDRFKTASQRLEAIKDAVKE